MYRDTVYNSPQKKYFRGEDVPIRSKRATHLVTYSNFLVADQDHSYDRPFEPAVKSTQKKLYNVTNNSDLLADGLPNQGKKNHERTHEGLTSAYNLIEFEPKFEGQGERAPISRKPDRQASNLDTAGKPVTDDSVKPARNIKNVALESCNVKASLTLE